MESEIEEQQETYSFHADQSSVSFNLSQVQEFVEDIVQQEENDQQILRHDNIQHEQTMPQIKDDQQLLLNGIISNQQDQFPKDFHRKQNNILKTVNRFHKYETQQRDRNKYNRNMTKNRIKSASSFNYNYYDQIGKEEQPQQKNLFMKYIQQNSPKKQEDKNSQVIDKNQIQEYIIKSKVPAISSPTNLKTNKRINKEKQTFLNFPSAFKQMYLRLSEHQNKPKFNTVQLVYLIELYRIRQYENSLKKMIERISIMLSEINNQKKVMQSQCRKMSDINQQVLTKLKRMQQKIQDIQQFYCQSPIKKYQLSFSKKQQPSSSNRSISFAKTFINTLQQLELKQVEEEEEAHTKLEKGLIELLYTFKKKVEGQSINISEGLINRVTANKNGKLFEWIKIIDEEITVYPNVRQFATQNISGQNSEKNINQHIATFLSTIQDNQQHLISKIKQSNNKHNQFHCLQFSCWLTLLAIIIRSYQIQKNRSPVKNNKKSAHKQKNNNYESQKQQTQMNIGILARLMRIIAMKSGINMTVDESQPINSSQKVIVVYSQYIQKILGCVNSLIDLYYH